MAKNLVTKNLQKTGENAVIVGASVFIAHGLCGMMKLSDDLVPALTVAISAILAGCYNAIRHLGLQIPFTKVNK